MQDFETVIGLEIHIQLNTESKAFCRDSNEFGLAPNSQTGAVSLALPGTLPYPNRQQVRAAVKIGLAIGATIHPEASFDRKNYFYPDLPKGYQITQDRQPICTGGAIPIRIGNTTKHIQIRQIHMEEDAGKIIHKQDSALLDFNRAGTPLLEMVTEPDLRSAEEVDALMSTVRRLVRYLKISDGNMEQGSMRCDCNISLRPAGQSTFGNRCEIKNLNSMRFARNAIRFEVQRQLQILRAGKTVSQQTLTFDPATGRTSPIRSKEDAPDYRYFPEPDIPPLQISPEEIEDIQKQLPVLPWQYYKKFSEYGLAPKDAALLIEEHSMAEYFERFVSRFNMPVEFANLLIHQIRPHLTTSIERHSVPQSTYARLLTYIRDKKITKTQGFKQILPTLWANPSLEPDNLIAGLDASVDEAQIKTIIAEILNAHPDKVNAYKKGKKGLIGFFMGQLMRQAGKQIDPETAKQLLEEMLDSEAN